MLIGDQRECAKAVNAMLAAAEDERASRPVVEGGREKQKIRRAFLFGHYDSRGGATLLLASWIGEAVQKYAKAFGMFDADPPKDAEEERERLETMQSLFEEDFETVVEVTVCDGTLGDQERDLDQDYGEDGFRYGRVQRRPKASKSGKWENTQSLVMWKGPKPSLVVKEDGYFAYRLEREKLGEDAFGLLFVP